MKKFITILISCSLAMAAGAMAQQEEASPQPPAKGKGERHPAKEEGTPPKEIHTGQQSKPGGEPKVEKEMKPTPKPEAPRKLHAETAKDAEVTNTPKATASPEASAAPKGRGKDATRRSAAQSNEPAKGKAPMTTPTSATTATPAATKSTSPTPASTAVPSPTASASVAMSPSATPATSASPAGSAATTSTTQQTNRVNAQAKKPDPQLVEKVKTEHANFKAQPKPDKVPAVTFNQNYHIEGSDRWQGQQYERFRTYHPEMHDQNYYRSRYSRVEIIGGGAYYWNDGYWYPAWGYDRSAQYYPYDGPIYVGHHAEPPDRVIADVQAILQEQGYYKGEVDGLLGPLTRQALTAYQSDNGLYTTAVIDEPTLDSLNLG